MANALTIVYGSTTVNLNSGDYALVDYAPSYGDGKTAVEKIRLNIKASSHANLQSDIQAIQKAIEMAALRYDSGIGDKVWLKFCPDSLSTTYRSEIVRPEAGEDAGLVEFGALQFGWCWRLKYADALLVLVRRDYWEADSEVELSLRNNSGSGTSGIAVRNSHSTTPAINAVTTISFTASTRRISDSGSGLSMFAVGDVISVRGSASNDGVYTVTTLGAGNAFIVVSEPLVDEAATPAITIYDYVNYVDILGTDITGMMPTPLKLEFSNSETTALESVWVASNWRSSPLTFAHMLEAEDSATGSNTANAGASSGQYRVYTIATTEAAVTSWTLPSVMMAAAGSNYFRVMARFFDSTDIVNCEYRLKVLYGSTVLWDSGLFTFLDTYEPTVKILREFATVQLPPYMLEGSSPPDLTLQLLGASTTGSAETVKLDYLMLLPLDGYRKFRSVGGLAQYTLLMDDGIDGTVYYTVSTSRIDDIQAEGKQIMLVPGKTTRIYFQYHTPTDATAAIDHLTTNQAHFRPRVRLI